MYANRSLRTSLGALLCLGIAASVAPAALLSERSRWTLGRATSAQKRLCRLAAKLSGTGPRVLAEVQPVKLINLTPLSTANDRLPCWSQNGRRVVFVSDRTGTDRIWSMDVDGSNLRQLTFGPGRDSYPAMSPGGEFLAYASNRFGTWDLFLRDLALGTEQRLTFWSTSDEIEPTWSPLGNELAFSSDYLDPQGDYHIWLVGTHSGITRRLTDTIFEERNPEWNIVYPQLVAYTGTEPNGDHNLWLSEVGAAAPGSYQLVSDPDQDFDPTWDPTGSRICFVSDRGGNNDLWLLDVIATSFFTDEIVITPEDPVLNPASNALEFWLPRTANDVEPSWRPLNLYSEPLLQYPRIAFTSDDAGNNDIWIVAPQDRTEPNINYDADESPLVQVTPQQTHPGEFVKITAAVSDNESGVDRVFAAIKCADSPVYVTVKMGGVLENVNFDPGDGEMKRAVDYLMIDANTGRPHNQAAAYDPWDIVYGPVFPPPPPPGRPVDPPGWPGEFYSDRVAEERLTFIDRCLELRDDGGISGSGDDFAGDGVYSAIWQVPTASDSLDYNPASDYYVDIIAWDRVGNYYGWTQTWGSWWIPHPPNGDLAPQACFNADRHYAMPGETVNFDASCSFDPIALYRECQNNQGVCEECEYKDQEGFGGGGGSARDFHWDFGDGSIERHLDLVSHAYAEPGEYTVTLTVWDGPSYSAFRRYSADIYTAEITVVADPMEIPDNLPPVAMFTEDIHNPQWDTTPDNWCDNLISWDGSASYDEDGDAIVRYDWDFDGDYWVDYYESIDEPPLDGNFDGIYDPLGIPGEMGFMRFVYTTNPDAPYNMIHIVTLQVTDERGEIGIGTDWKYVGDISKYNNSSFGVYYDSYGVDHIAGFTAREFPAGGAHPWLLVNDYGCGQKSQRYTEGIFGFTRNWPSSYIAEDAWNDEPFVIGQHREPEQASSLLLSRARFQELAEGHVLVYHGDYSGFYAEEEVRAIGDYFGIGFPEQYDEWRILCRGPIDYTILEDYLPVEITWQGGETDGQQAMHATKAVIWASPYSGDLRVHRGTIIDPQTWEVLTAFLDNGGRLLMHGQDIAWALTKNGQQTNTLLRDYFHVEFGDNDPRDRITAEPDNGRFLLSAQLVNGYSLTDNFWENHGGNATISELWTGGRYADGADNHPAGDALPNHYWQDSLIPIEPAESVYEYADPSNHAGVTATTGMIQYVDEQRGFRTIFSAVGLEGVQQRYVWVDPPGVVISHYIRSNLLHNIGDFMRTGVLSGNLRYSQTHEPVEGAAVEVIDDWGPSPNDGNVMGSAISLADGSWTIPGIPPSIYLIRITHEDEVFYYHLSRNATCGGFVQSFVTIDISKPAPGTISGRVLELNGTTGIPGATVTFTSGQGDVFTTTTAIDGTYSVQVTEGTYTGVASKEDYASATRTGIVVRVGEARTGINFILGIPGNIAGTVTISHEGFPDDGSPLEDALIEVLSGTTRIGSAYTDADGIYLIEDLPTGIYNVRASAPGFTTQTQGGVLVIGNATTTVNFQLPVVVPDELHRWAAGGLYLISLPGDFETPGYDPAQVLHYTPELTAVSLATWVPLETRYELYPMYPVDFFHAGRGYWLRTAGAARVTVETPPDEITDLTYQVRVQAGWNMIGNPYSEEDGVAWADVEVRLDSGATYDTGLAADLGYIRRTLWGWDGANYVQSAGLLPWQGYWMNAAQACTLMIPKPVPPGPPPPPPPP